jgi:DNA-binding transcriptional ArsR family regulator
LNNVEENELSQIFAALADPTRRAILAHLAREDATVNVLAGPFRMSLQAVSRHLKVLEGAGLITRGRDAQFRPCALREAPLESAAGWIAHTRAAWRRGADQSFPPSAAASDPPPAPPPDERPGTAQPESAFATRGDWAK